MPALLFGLVLPLLLAAVGLPAQSAAASPGVRAGWDWPLRGAAGGAPVVVRRFEPPAHPYGPGHRGVDLAGHDGATVSSAGAGVVAFAGSVAGRPVVSIDHPGGLRTTYEPVAPRVAAGRQVAAGEPIGRLTAPGSHCPPRACLHWGLRRGRDYLDPLALLGLARVRLLPLLAPSPGAPHPETAPRGRQAVQGAAPPAPGRPAEPAWQRPAGLRRGDGFTLP